MYFITAMLHVLSGRSMSHLVHVPSNSSSYLSVSLISVYWLESRDYF